MTAAKIAALNDALRQTSTGGRVMLTRGVAALDQETLRHLFNSVRRFNDFTEDNDPYGEHDFGSVEIEDQKFFWKIDCYAPDMLHGSRDPSDPAKTVRVLTIMQASEY